MTMSPSLSLHSISHDDLQEIAQACHTTADAILDIGHCTPLQIVTIAGYYRHHDTYCYRGVFALADNVDTERWIAASALVIESNAILRTRIVDSTTHGLVQVVLRDGPPVCRTFDDLDSYVQHDRSQPMGLGVPLLRWALVDHTLVFTLHHAVYDLTAIRNFAEDVAKIYDGQNPPIRAPFRQFVERCLHIDDHAAQEFWRPRFKNLGSIFPPFNPSYTPRATAHMIHKCLLPQRSAIPTAQIPAFIEAAWALVSSIYTGEQNVSYGLIFSGRTPQLGEIGTTLGPTVVTIPVQVNLDFTASIGQLVKDRAKERRLALSNPALQYGPMKIRAVSEEASVASNFQAVLSIGMATTVLGYTTKKIRCVSESEGVALNGIFLRFTLQPNQILIDADFDPTVISEAQMARVLHQFEHVLRLLVGGPQDRKLQHIPLLSANDWAEISGWNAKLPEPIERSLHGLFQDRSGQHPQKLAIEAFDRNATYGELDDLSSRLAQVLVAEGVRLGDAVLIHCDRSCWAVICILATMKAGGCCVPIATTNPRPRKKAIVTASRSKFLITCDASDDVEGFVDRVILVSPQTLPTETTAFTLPDVSAEQVAYVLFTSGSTGLPKGVMLEHQSIASSLMACHDQQGWTSDDRLLQFSALVWDISILDIFGALLFGRCLCIPSNDDREANLAVYIEGNMVNWANLTPTVLRTLSPADVPSLQNIVSLGEAIDGTAAKLWGDRAHLINAWGVSEASMVSSGNIIKPDSLYPRSIGRPIGCALWIVDPNDPQRLTSIGAVGEILIEGVTVARGYLNVEPGTAFIAPPFWSPPRLQKSKFYRTGDLARYLPDGSIDLVGRKDNQVKIRGQRFELGEVESCISGKSTIVLDAVAMVYEKPGGNKDLVAIISLQDPSLPHEKDLQELDPVAVEQQLGETQEHCKLHLPTYMIPKFWKIVERLPRNASAKIDRSAVKKWLEACDLAPSILKPSENHALSPPTEEAEQVLRYVWSSVLSVPVTQIGRETSFIGVGGDSISAMQVTSRYRKQGYHTSVPILLNSTSLASVVQQSKSSLATQAFLPTLTGAQNEGDLSPIQKLLMDHDGPASNNHFNQSWIMEFQSEASSSELAAALLKLVGHHSNLRTLFSQQSDGRWQATTSASHDALRFQHHTDMDEAQVHSTLVASQKSFDISKGPLFAADLIEMRNGKRVLFFAAHHLVIDLVSWRIIWEDLEALLQDPDATLPPASSFHAYVQRQRDTVTLSTQPAWPRADRDFWAISGKHALTGNMVTSEFSLDVEVTDLLMRGSNTALNTNPMELLLSALLMSFHQIFVDRGPPALYVESHGRQTEIDVSRTVGWFTLLFPILMAIEPTSSAEVVADVKDGYRQALKTAHQSFAEKMYGPDPLHFRDLEICFNFMGRLQQVDQDGGLLKILPDMRSLQSPDIADDAEQMSLIVVNAVVVGDRLHFRVDWNKHMAHQARLHAWVTMLEHQLSTLARSFSKRETLLTRCDMPLLQVDDPSLQQVNRTITELGIRPQEVEAIHPVSPAQEGILFAQIRGPGNVYCDRVDFKITTTNHDTIDVGRLCEAWKSVCRAHAMLRTIFVSGLTSSAAFQQVILKDPIPTIRILKSLAEDERSGHPAWEPVGTQLPQCLLLRQISDSEVYATISISHALIDGTAFGIIASQLSIAYTNHGRLPNGHDFAEYLVWLQQRKKTSWIYWQEYLSGVSPCLLPAFVTSKVGGPSIHHLDTVIPDIDTINRFCQQSGVTIANFLHVAWGIVLRRFTKSESVAFGYLYSGRDAFTGADEIIGPLISMLVARLKITPSSKVKMLLETAKADMIKALENPAVSLAEVQDALSLRSGPLFNTVLSIQRDAPSVLAAENSLIQIEPVAIDDPSEYAVVVNIAYSEDMIRCRLNFQLESVPEEFGAEILSTFKSITHELAHLCGSDTDVSSFAAEWSRLTMFETSLLKSWNDTTEVMENACLHDRIRQVAAHNLHAPAVCFQGQEMTYRTLDDLSDRLASELWQQGVRAEQIVPFFCEKSLLAVVYMLAIVKTGGVVLGMDVGYPNTRLTDMMQDAKASVLLCQPSLAGRAQQFAAGKGLCYDLDTIKALTVVSPPPSAVDPSNAAYCIYTSGSTGKPKGIVVSHSNIVTSLTSHLKPMGISARTRTLQISSFTFDMSLVEVFQTLLAGGCICMPSEFERMNDIEGAITRMRANFLYTTPSLARVLDPTRAPTLKTLVLMGEALTVKAVERWQAHVRLMACYGPAETAALSSCVDVNPSQISNLGRPLACRYWVVNEDDHNQLLSIGCVGELLIQGPIVSRGYLNDREKTASAFIPMPDWTSQVSVSGDETQTVYKTGDLVLQNLDGSVAHVGRKDFQVKLRGQRIELGEIESILHKSFPAWPLVVELVQPDKHDNDPFLVVFMSKLQDSRLTAHLQPEEPLQPETTMALAMREVLTSTLPGYMVPDIYIPLPALRLNSSGKTDRRRLRSVGQGLTAEQLLLYSTHATTRVPSLECIGSSTGDWSDSELCLRRLWSQVFSMPETSIRPDSDWVGMGGNSLKAIRLVSAAKEQNLPLTVADIFRNPRLNQLAKILDRKDHRDDTISESMPIAPYSLISVDAEIARQHAAAVCAIDASQVEDIYPCTELQQGLMALSLRRTGDFVAQILLVLKPQIAIGRFQRAWAKLVEETPILRTQIVDIPGQGISQVIVDAPVEWSDCSAESLQDQKQMTLGSPLSRVSIKRGQGGSSFIWTAHHAVYDGWLLPLVLQALEQNYFSETCKPLTPYQPFVKHMLTASEGGRAAAYWRDQFTGLEAPQFPPLPSATYQPHADVNMQHFIQGIEPPSHTFTLATVIRGAWAALISRHTAAPEAVLGVVVNGRQASLSGIDRTGGPTLASVPVRIIVNPQSSVVTFLRSIQEQAVDMTPWEQTGLRNIQKASLEAESACRFQTLLLIQSAEQSGANLINGSRLFSSAHGLNDANAERPYDMFNNYALQLECEQSESQLTVRFSFDSNVISRPAVSRIAQQFEHILRSLCDNLLAEPMSSIAELMNAGEQDLADIWRWNGTVPELVNKTVPQLLEPIFLRQPERPAICAWDGSLTYAELAALSTKVAQHLRLTGVRPGTRVALLFEKSMWNPVAALAIIKAGGTSTMLDVSQPMDRLASIIKQLNPVAILSSTSQAENARKMSKTSISVMTIDQTYVNELPEPESGTPPLAETSDAIWVAYTSGSTGQPKGAVISHGNICSALQHQAHAIGLSSTSRVFDFSSYAWDMAWYNLLHCLYAGGCLCIPSEQQRISDLSGALVRFDANFIATTPTVANLLDESALQNLSAVEIVGEVPSADLLSKLKQNRRRCRNIYGPTECTVIAGGSDDLRHPSHIGVGVGVVPWVVDSTTQQLVPVGCIGELWLEGPLVGQGYLNDEQQTSEVYVDAPVWLLKGTSLHPGRSGKLYRTGDLVKYEQDGSLTIMGRTDGQVKIRGQRVELTEVEQHFKRNLNRIDRSGTVEVVAETLFRPNTNTRTLVVFIVPSGTEKSTQDELERLVTDLVADIDDRLGDTLPSYMLPNAYIPLREVPLTPTGKTDRRLLRDHGVSLSAIAGPSSDNIVVPPTNEIESELCDLWAEILSISKDAVSVVQRWSRLGGDSILAMQAVAKARQRNLGLTMDFIFRLQTIRQIASAMTIASEPSATTSLLQCSPDNSARESQWFDLAPIQRWYFETHPARICFDIPLLLHLNTRVDSTALRQAIESVVSKHPMLRARFEQDENTGIWRQQVTHKIQSSYYLNTYQHTVEGEIPQLICQAREMLDLEAGPLLVAGLFNHSSGSQSLFLSIHHLVNDMMSWRIVLQDLEDIIAGRPMAPMPPRSDYQSWISGQKQFAQSRLHPDVAYPDHAQLIPANLAYWGLNESTTQDRRPSKQTLTLGQATTSRILSVSSRNNLATLNELLVASLLFSFKQEFSDRPLPPCFCAGHGREAFDGTIDVSQTVGWFTSSFPCQLPSSSVTGSAADDLCATIHGTIKAFRKVPYSGWAYGASRYLHPEGKKLLKASETELSFNFLGSLEQLGGEQDDSRSLFKLLELPEGSQPESVDDFRPIAVFDVQGHVVGRQLQFVLNFTCDEGPAKRLLQRFAETLDELSNMGPILR